MDVGNTGLAWLFFSYGYVLFKASELISEGSDLLLLVPSLAGLGMLLFLIHCYDVVLMIHSERILMMHVCLFVCLLA